ncbi:HTH-type transcriptional regulator KipR [Anaerolineales bacterium]|nr:HTH-type transcriptional regulator KipR [Anaerolineales bacterium]
MSESIRAVERALDVLLCFTSQTPELTMSQISERTGINKSTVHRLLSTLEKKRFVERNPLTGIYSPGLRFLQMASLSMEQNSLHRLAAPFLQELQNQYHENVNLALLDGADVVYMDVIESSQRVKLAAVPGQRLPAFCTASGKSILAFLPDDDVKRILERGMPGYTRSTVTSQEAFFEDVYRIRERGFAMSLEEFEDGINAVAAPICNQPIASVSIAGPAYRLTQERMLDIGPGLVSVAKNISLEVERVLSLE